MQKKLTSTATCVDSFLPFFSVFFATNLAASDATLAVGNTKKH